MRVCVCARACVRRANIHFNSYVSGQNNNTLVIKPTWLCASLVEFPNFNCELRRRAHM